MDPFFWISPPPPCVQLEEVSHGSLPTSLLFGLPLHTLAETTAFFRWKMTMILATNDDCYRGGRCAVILSLIKLKHAPPSPPPWY